MSVPMLPATVQASGLELIAFPSRMAGVPSDRNAFRRTLDLVLRRLLDGKRVVVTCRGVAAGPLWQSPVWSETSWFDGPMARLLGARPMGDVA